MRKYLPMMSIFLMWMTFTANAQVEVAWTYREELPGNQSRIVRPSVEYIRKMRVCGIDPKLTKRDTLRFKDLECPGLLDKSRSEELKARLTQIIKREIPGPEGKIFIEEVRTLTFAFSHQAVFLGGLDGPGDPRLLAVNIPAMKLVIFNTIMWKKLEVKSAEDFTLLHEALVALGYEDQHYQISHNHIAGRPLKLKKSKTKMSGVYGFTHGGETTSATFKASLMQAIRENKLTINWDQEVPDKFKPSQKRMLEIVENTEMGVMAADKMMELKLCNSFDGQFMGKEYCGHFALNGANNLPVMMIATEWGTFTPQEKNHELLHKIYILLYVQLLWEAGYQ